MKGRNLRLQRNILVGGLVLMVTSNTLLSLQLGKQTQTTILVPTLGTQLEIGTAHVSEEYLRLRAGEVITLLFSLNATNSESILQLLLKQVANPARSEFQKQVEMLAADIKERKYYYHFGDIQGYKINSKHLKVTVQGYLETYFNDKRISRKYKEYEIAFVNNGGIVLLSSFGEVNDAK